MNYSNGDPTVTTAYDQSACLGLSTCQNIGQRTSVTDAAGSESWAYQVDSTNQRSVHVNQRTTSSVQKNSTYYLDLAGNLTQIVYPTGRVLNYSYSAANRPITATDGSNGITYATDFQSPPMGCLSAAVCYTPQGTFYALSIGQATGFTGLNLTHTYNSRLQPNEFKASSTGGNAIDITYSFIDSVTGHNAGHVNSITNNLDSTRSQTFTYDSLNRITGALTTSTHATSPAHCWGEAYTLDAWGNLNSIAATTNSAYTGCTEESGFSTTADGNNHLPIFGYDASGNTANDGVVTNYQWDAESELKSAAGVAYTYDSDGRRVSKVGSKLYWYGSGGEILAETNTSGATTAEYIFFGGKRVAMLPAGNSAQFYVEDMIGTSRVITTNSGVVCYDADFYPYGGERTPYTNNCPTTNNYKFEGKERDTETGNDDFGARYYSNRFGRWLSADWSAVPAPIPYANFANPQTLNLYSMVADDPESFADLDGHCGRYILPGAPPEACNGSYPGAFPPPGEGFALDENSGIPDWYLGEVSAESSQIAAQQGAQELSADAVTKIIEQAKQSGSDSVTTAFAIFNNLGNNVTVSGSVLRDALSKNDITLPDSIAPVLKNAEQISKSGNTITVKSKAETSFRAGEKKEIVKGKEVIKDKGHEIKVSTTVSFSVHVAKGTASLTQFSGLSVKALLTWHDFNAVSFVSTGPGQGVLTIDANGLPNQTLHCSANGCQ